MNVIHYFVGQQFREFRGSVAVHENIIRECCIAYVWLIQKYKSAKYTIAIDSQIISAATAIQYL